MHRSFIFPALIAILFVAFAGSAQTPAEWQKVSPSGGRFEALYPAVPKTYFSTINTAAGDVANGTVMVENNEVAYLVMYSDWPAAITDVQGSLAASRENVVRQMNAELVSSKQTNVGGYAALLYTVKIEITGEVLVGTVLVTYVGRRQYQVIVVQPQGKASPGEASKFISSFKLVA